MYVVHGVSYQGLIGGHGREKQDDIRVIVPYVVPVPAKIYILVASVTNLVFNSMLPGWCGCDREFINFDLISRIYILSIASEIVLKYVPLDLTGDNDSIYQEHMTLIMCSWVYI